ncbi:hypothetical protein NDU88_002504 [Pleurodeles waltl]|uniref:Uncharacterized protein n=1 Tax=Pleurodeles waltl TaxID=8319 RepID=A0AAV7VAQ4_PLEWA|nr:hypothetical protein NDU88_002504 [Pleurodeles waltl]
MWPRAEEEEVGHISRVQCQEKSVSVGTKEEDRDAKEGEATNARDRHQESEEMEQDRGHPKQHSQEMQSFGIEAESCSSVVVGRDNPEEKNWREKTEEEKTLELATF